MTARPAAATERNLLIQQLRGWAILSVLLAHFSLLNQVLASLPWRVTNPGYLGVELFFVISGFVVTRSLQAHGWGMRHFVVRRAFRLYPAILVFLALCLVVWGATRGWEADALPRRLFGGEASAFLRQAFGVLTGTLTFGYGPEPYVFAAMWSLTIEFQFYAALALLAAALALAGRQAATARAVAWLAVLVVAGYQLARLPLLWGAPALGPRALLLWRFDFLAAGVLVALAPAGWRQRLALARPGLVAVLAVAVAMLALAGFRHPLAATAAGARNWLELLGYPFALLGFAWALAAAAEAADAGVGRTVLGRAMLWLGDRSYSLYLLHFPVLALLWMALWLAAPGVTNLPWSYAMVQAVLGGALCCAAAAWCYRWVERPGISLAGRLLRRGRALSPAG